jgi:hypothetical protein
MVWSEGEPTPQRLSEGEEALFDMIHGLKAALTLRDAEIAELKVRIAELEATPQPVEVRVVDARKRP